MSEVEKKNLIAMLMEVAKAHGLPVAEETAEAMIPMFIAMGDAIVGHTSNKVDDIVWLPVKGPLEDLLEKLAEKINPND